MKRYLTGLFLIVTVVAGCSKAHAHSPGYRQEAAAIITCNDIADLKAEILDMRREGTSRAEAKRYVGDKLAGVPGITLATIRGYQKSVNEIYAIPPLGSHQEVMGVRGVIFSNCVDMMMGDTQ